jgi:hypothetical protein
MSQLDTEATFHEIVGVCTGVEINGDWTKFAIDIGRQYPVKLATKKQDIIDTAMVAHRLKETRLWKYGEMEGGPNPHRPGENYKNRYLNEVADPSQASPAAAAPAASGRASDVDKDDLIVRQFALREARERARDLMPIVGKDGEQPDVLLIAEEYARWVWQKTAREAVGATDTSVEQEAEVGPTPDDDIPF